MIEDMRGLTTERRNKIQKAHKYFPYRRVLSVLFTFKLFAMSSASLKPKPLEPRLKEKSVTGNDTTVEGKGYTKRY
jgi:hypothetical protein